MPPVVLDLAAARRWAVATRQLLGEARTRIDALNVFPVPDGDTGTNMFLTVDGALDLVRGQHELAGAAPRLDEELGLIARGMLLSARGNSGVILSQLGRGLAEAVHPDQETIDAATLASAFERAAQAAYAGVGTPVEGTILSVARAAASGAVEAARDPAAGAYAVALAALQRAREALERTPDQLPALAEAGVVDAGGAGLVVLVEALEMVLSGRPAPQRVDPDQEDPTWGSTAEDPTQSPAAGSEVHEPVEVMYLLTHADPERAAHLRAHLEHLGDSVQVVGGPQEWRVHVHGLDPAALVEAGSAAGRVEQVRVESLTTTERETEQHPASSRLDVAPDGHGQGLGVVACVLGEGWAQTVLDAGAQVVHSGPGRRASTGQLIGAVHAAGTSTVVLLPNDGDTLLAAMAAAEEAQRDGVRVVVVPTRSPLQGLAALAVLDHEGETEQVLADMRAAAEQVCDGALTRADHDGVTPVGTCRQGQWLGLVSGEVIVVHDDLEPAAEAVLTAMLSAREHPELVTVVAGADADCQRAALQEVAARAVSVHPGLEVVRLGGDQPVYPWLIGVE